MRRKNCGQCGTPLTSIAPACSLECAQKITAKLRQDTALIDEFLRAFFLEGGGPSDAGNMNIITRAAARVRRRAALLCREEIPCREEI